MSESLKSTYDDILESVVDESVGEEIDKAIYDLEIRSEEISRGGNADILLEEE